MGAGRGVHSEDEASAGCEDKSGPAGGSHVTGSQGNLSVCHPDGHRMKAQA